MAPNPRRIAQRLDALYARLPRMECKGHCHDSCGPVPAGYAEAERIRRATGIELGVRSMECADCTLLEGGRCMAYDVRPMICRLWGMVENLPCHYGCVPEGGRLSVEVGYAFLAEVFDIAGWPPGYRDLANSDIAHLSLDPEQRRFLLNFARPRVDDITRAQPRTVLHADYRR